MHTHETQCLFIDTSNMVTLRLLPAPYSYHMRTSPLSGPEPPPEPCLEAPQSPDRKPAGSY